jgi:hypothetical protein
MRCDRVNWSASNSKTGGRRPYVSSTLTFGNTELSLELWTVISGISGFDD